VLRSLVLRATYALPRSLAHVKREISEKVGKPGVGLGLDRRKETQATKYVSSAQMTVTGSAKRLASHSYRARPDWPVLAVDDKPTQHKMLRT